MLAPRGKSPPPSLPGQVAVVLAAAGNGSRMGTRQTDGSATPKQWLALAGLPVVVHAFRLFDSMPQVGQIAVALDSDSLERNDRTAKLKSAFSKPVHLVAGGTSRQDSVWRALQAFNPEPEIVMIHDAARPFPPVDAVERSIALARAHGGAILARRIVETVKRADANMLVTETLDRRDLWAAQTPQTFQFAPLAAAFRSADDLARFTDDAAVFQAVGGAVCIVESSTDNFKITHAEDLRRAERRIRFLAEQADTHYSTRNANP
jgi:2-C-methyl-D-erythritol 4-phosphate cytidylyltransferase